ncbi:hypothetical protein, partial [Myroides odoratimimus]|uniref:hypothetical protein n=1 Tax=Myroides odoratimimus TaxID=76832 RepID=UPI002577B1C5
LLLVSAQLSNPVDTLEKFTDFTLHRATINKQISRILANPSFPLKLAFKVVRSSVFLYSRLLFVFKGIMSEINI